MYVVGDETVMVVRFGQKFCLCQGVVDVFQAAVPVFLHGERAKLVVTESLFVWFVAINQVDDVADFIASKFLRQLTEVLALDNVVADLLQQVMQQALHFAVTLQIVRDHARAAGVAYIL